MKETFAHKHGTPPARVAVVRIRYSLNGDGRCPLISQWIALPSERPEHQDVANTPTLRRRNWSSRVGDMKPPNSIAVQIS
jgi:hypothetical protein